MKNPKSLYFIVAISLSVGVLHFVLGPDYHGPLRNFVRGYLIDMLLPMNLYLLLQISLRKIFTIGRSRTIAAFGVFAIGLVVEIAQYNKIHLFGSTFDPMDLLMYGIGIGLGMVLDLTIVERLENAKMR